MGSESKGVVGIKIYLKALDIIGNCHRLVFSLGASQHMHKITNL